MSNGAGVVEAALEAEDPIGRVNIAVYGATGAGKSTLVNAIFGADVAPTGVGEPVTRDTALYVNDAGTLGIYDGAGLELGQRRSPARDLQARVRRNRKQRDVGSFIHVAWYCVDGRGSRLEAGQQHAIRAIAEAGVPVVLVLTRVTMRDGVVHPETEQLVDEIRGMDLPIVSSPVLTAALDDEFDNVQRHGLEELLQVTYGVVPEAQRIAIAAAQKIDLKIKARYARSWIAGAVAFAGGVGATPIPLADAAVLIPAQAALMVRIAAVYDIPRDKAAKLAGAATAVASTGGKVVAGSLAKLVPGVGSVISASVAGTVTGVLGESWRATSERVFVGKVDLDDAAQLAEVAKDFTRRAREGRGAAEAEPARNPAEPAAD